MRRPSRRQVQGQTLLELVVALAIGLLVLGAVLGSFVASGKTARQQVAVAEMVENAQLGLGLISRELLLAGFSVPTGLSPSGASLTRAYADRPVFGCKTGFESPRTVGPVVCAAAGTDALEVVYEATVDNTLSTAANLPTDCLGNGLSAVAGVRIAYNRYYVASGSTGRGELHCASRQGASGQPLVDNVQGMTLWFGEANASTPRAVVRYVGAHEVSDWRLVISVRVCLLMRSSEPVLDAGEDRLSYTDCDLVQQSSSDRFLRRAFFSTTTLRNQMAF